MVDLGWAALSCSWVRVCPIYVSLIILVPAGWLGQVFSHGDNTGTSRPVETLDASCGQGLELAPCHFLL